MLLIAIEIVKAVLAFMVPKFVGNVNFADGMLAVETMIPMGAVLQEPVVICLPLVRGRLGTVRQKLMKLLEEVKEGTCPASGTSCPLSSKPTEITAGSRVREVWGLPPAFVLLLVSLTLLVSVPLFPAEELAAGGALVVLDEPVNTVELDPDPFL